MGILGIFVAFEQTLNWTCGAQSTALYDYSTEYEDDWVHIN